MAAFEDFMVLEMSRRSPHLTYETTSYDGDPNSGSAPAILQGAPKGTWFLQQTGDIWWRKRTSAADSWVVANLNATFEDVDMYVRAADGDDSNPGTSASPLETLVEAVARIPKIVRHAVRIHVGPHTGSGYAQPTIRNIDLDGGNIYFYGDGGGGGTDGFTEIVSSTAALAGSSDVLVATSGLSTTEFGGFGEYYGSTIEILTGDAAGDRRGIHHNTATGIIPNMHFSSAIAEGDTYRIVKPAIVIYQPDSISAPVLVENVGTARGEDYRSEMACRVWFINFRFTSAGNDFRIVGNLSRVQLYGIYSENSYYIYGDNTYFSGLDRVPSTTPPTISFLVTDWGLSSESEWRGWGLVCDSTSANKTTQLIGSPHFEGGCNVPAIATYSWGQGSLIMPWGSIWGNGGGYAIRNYYGFISEFGGYPFVPLYIGSPTGSSGGVACEGSRSKVSFNCVFSVSGPAIKIQGTGNAIVSTRAGEIAIFVVNPSYFEIDVGGIGVLSKLRGIIVFTSNLPDITATGGDFSENNGLITRAISELGSGDMFSDLVHGLIYRE